MRAAHEYPWIEQTEQEIVHQLFSIRWTTGCTFTRLHGHLDDSGRVREQIDTWARTLVEIIPQTGHAHVSLLDTTSLGEIPRELWLDLAKMVHQLPRKPMRRAVMTADGWRGDNQAQTGQLITAGHIRVFGPDEREAMIRWASQAGTIDVYRLRALVD